MSASDKKRIRREENMAAMTERQQQEAAEAKKLKLYSGLFIAAIAVMIVVVIVSSVINSGIIQRNTTAITVDGEKISAVELNYFYIDSINTFLDSYGSYVSMLGLDTSKPLDEQYYNESEKITWADQFLTDATENVRASYVIYNEANANGYELPEEAKTIIETSINNIEISAPLMGYESAKAYLTAMYGKGSDLKTLEHYLTVQLTADRYYTHIVEGLEYTADEMKAELDANPTNYISYNYHYYYLASSKYYEGGTKDDAGTVTYSTEEKIAAAAKAEADAKALAECKTVEEFDKAIAALSVNADAANAVSTNASNRRYNGIESVLTEWVTDSSRKEGDTVYLPNTSTVTEDGKEIEVVNGYYIAVFGSVNDNTYNLKDVRHILVSYEGGTTGSDGLTVYTEEEKATALKKAQDILNEYEAGAKTAEAFGELANKYSTDGGSNTTGGLYQYIYPGQMVAEFEDWTYDEARKAGDTGIVNSTYGYHVMYFVGDSDMNYRDYLITTELKSKEIADWQKSLTDAAQLETVNTNYVLTDLVLNTGN